MIDTQSLNVAINESGLKRYYIASKLGINVYSLQKKIENKTQFKADEIKKICSILKINSLEEREKIFFVASVDEKSTDEEK